MQLRQWQILFKNFIQDKSPADFGAEPQKSLNIYKSNYFNKLISQIKNKYPKTFMLLNKELLYRYITSNPSRSCNLDNYGNNLPKFLLLEKLLMAAEIAKFELAIFLCSLSEHDKHLSINKMLNIKPSDFHKLYFSFNKSVNIQKISSASYKIFTEGNKGQDKEQTTYTHLLIYPKSNKAVFCTIPLAEYIFIKYLMKGKSLLSAIEKSLMIEPHLNIQNTLNNCFKNKLFNNYDLKK